MTDATSPQAERDAAATHISYLNYDYNYTLKPSAAGELDEIRPMTTRPCIADLLLAPRLLTSIGRLPRQLARLGFVVVVARVMAIATVCSNGSSSTATTTALVPLGRAAAASSAASAAATSSSVGGSVGATAAFTAALVASTSSSGARSGAAAPRYLKKY